jgi:hypothetical protein
VFGSTLGFALRATVRVGRTSPECSGRPLKAPGKRVDPAVVRVVANVRAPEVCTPRVSEQASRTQRVMNGSPVRSAAAFAISREQAHQPQRSISLPGQLSLSVRIVRLR